MMINSLTSIGWESTFIRIVRYNLIIFLNLLIDWLNMLSSFWLTSIEIIGSYLPLKKFLVLPFLINTAFLITLSRSIDIGNFLWLNVIVAQGRWVKLSFDHIEMSSELSSLEIVSSGFAINSSIDLVVGPLDVHLPGSLLLSSICFECLWILLFVRFLIRFLAFFLN
jgi:hypothetical protein